MDDVMGKYDKKTMAENDLLDPTLFVALHLEFC